MLRTCSKGQGPQTHLRGMVAHPLQPAEASSGRSKGHGKPADKTGRDHQNKDDSPEPKSIVDRRPCITDAATGTAKAKSVIAFPTGKETFCTHIETYRALI